MKLSIITINFNDATGLEQTIKSVVNQNFEDFEYIIIDGNSTDNSVDIIKKYSEKIDYWISEPDNGIYSAMNKGIRQAKGEYIMFANSGDGLYNNDVLTNIFSKSTDKDVIYGDMFCRYEDGNTKTLTMPENLNVYFMFSCSVHHPSSLSKKYLFEKYGFFREDLKIVADWAFFLNLVAFTDFTYQYIPITMSSFAMDGISSDDEKREKEKNKVLKETFSPELIKVINFYYTFYAYDKFYNKKIFRIIRKVISFVKKK